MKLFFALFTVALLPLKALATPQEVTSLIGASFGYDGLLTVEYSGSCDAADYKTTYGLELVSMEDSGPGEFLATVKVKVYSEKTNTSPCRSLTTVKDSVLIGEIFQRERAKLNLTQKGIIDVKFLPPEVSFYGIVQNR